MPLLSDIKPPSAYQPAREPVKHLQTQLSLLHGKDDAILCSQPVDVTLSHWLRHMQNMGFDAYFENTCNLPADIGSVRRYSNERGELDYSTLKSHLFRVENIATHDRHIRNSCTPGLGNIISLNLRVRAVLMSSSCLFCSQI